MKRRLVSIALLLCLTLALLPVLPAGASRSDADVPYAVAGGNLYFNKETGTITDCDQTVTTANIPAEIGGVAVRAIGEGAFWTCIHLTSVTIPAGVTKIENSAFSGCSHLSAVKIPDGVTEIGEFLFSDCNALTSVTLPNSVTLIHDNAFYRCKSLTSVTIPAGVKQIGKNAFYHCDALGAVYFCGDAPQLGEKVFHTFSGVISGLKLYYIPGRSGWTSPTWNGYPTATWDGKTKPVAPAFTDVPANAWYAEAVRYAEENGLMNGMENNQFQPETPMSRAMLVTVLWRYAGSPEQGTNTFPDVPNGEWYTEAVAWAAANGIVNGVEGGRFDPDGNVTREQMATILYRYCGKLGKDASKAADLSAYPDASAMSDYALAAMRWAVAEKIINGSDGKLLPQNNATRAEVATILMRFIENVLK